MTQAHALNLPRRTALAGAATALLLLVLALALPALARADVPSYVVRNAATSCQNPDVSGDLVVWEDMANDMDIWAVSLAGGSAFPVVQLASRQQTPAVDGTTVVWADDRANMGVYRIRGATVDPVTGAVSEFAISSATGTDTEPDVSGRFVVWTRKVGTSYDIYGYDLLTGTEFPICTDVRTQDQPAISGDLVVWRDYSNNTAGVPDIVAGRISLPGYGITEIPIRAQGSVAPMYNEGFPAVHGSTVVWYDGRSPAPGAGIYAATVTGTTVSNEWKVSTVTRSTSNPAVNGSLIAWTYSGGTTNDDIYARRLDKSDEFAIASTTQFERTASVGASRTAWGNATNYDIYGADIGGFGWSAGVTIDGGAAHAMSRTVTLGLMASSSVGQATVMAFSNDGTTWTDWYAYATTFSWVLPSGDGTKTVYAKFKDAENNVSPVKSDTIVLDELAPVTDDDFAGGWATGDVSVTLTADDHAGSGVPGTGTVYDLDGPGDAYVTYSGPITVSGDGLHTLTYRSVDTVGRVEEPKVVQIWIDGTAPVTTDNAGAEWHPRGWVLKLDPYDAIQLERTEYSVNGGPWQTGMAVPLAVTRKRTGGTAVYQVRYRSIDAAGNVEAIRECTVRLDARAPVTTTDYDGLPSMTDLTVNLTGYDEHSGVGETWYSVDGGDFVEGASVLVPAPSDGSKDGAHLIAYYSVDAVGNVESVRWVVVTIAAGTP